MVKVLYLGLFAAIVCALVALTLAVPVGSTVFRNSSSDASYHHHPKPQEVVLSDDGAVRSERSTNLSHITGSARKIQMYVKNRHLQILPDGTVNGTSDDSSDYSKSHASFYYLSHYLSSSIICKRTCSLRIKIFTKLVHSSISCLNKYTNYFFINSNVLRIA